MKPTQPPTAREEAEELSVKIVRQYAAGIHILEREMLRKIIVKALLYFADGRLEEAEKIISEWARAYPEDVFTPLPKYGTPEQKAQDNVLVTRASAHMGRHMSKCLLEDIKALKSTAGGGGG